MTSKERVQLNLRFDEHSELLSAVRERCEDMGVTLTSFVATALQNELENTNRGQYTDLKTLAERMANLEVAISDINQELATLKKHSSSRAAQKTVIKNIGRLKSDGVLPRNLKPAEKDVGKFFNGFDGSLWQYLGIQKSLSSGLSEKQFQKIL